MRLTVDRKFVEEADRHGLRFTCRDCRYHLPETAGCAHEWPSGDHAAPPVLDPATGTAEFLFCKEFELF